MLSRRDVLKVGLAGAAYGLLTPRSSKGQLVFPDGFVPSIVAQPSPPVTPFITPLNVMPIKTSVPASALDPPPDPDRHQRYGEFLPQKYYIDLIQEFLCVYHNEPPYSQGTWSWGFNGITPGPTYHAWYGEPIFVRRVNELPPVGVTMARFAMPRTAIHLHNAHTASESDGIPMDHYGPGEYWDYHYANFPAGFDNREKLSTLWYHDHMLDFTATNVYAGLNGFYLLFDEKDSNNERDPGKQAFRLPSGKYDVPMILHDVQFDQNGQVIWDFFNPEPIPNPEPPFDPPYKPDPLGHTIFGMLGDRFTVNRTIQPFFQVEARKYRLRILNGGPSRFYELFLRSGSLTGRHGRHRREKFYVISTDGNLLPEPVRTESIRLSVAQRHDVIVDFSKFKPGDHVYLVNRLEMREDGAGPTGRQLDEGNLIMRFDVVRKKGKDHSRIPDRMRELPPLSLDDVRRERTWVFDYDNGMWTINGLVMEQDRIDARIEQGSAEIWTIRNGGNSWSHPVHVHFEEFHILERNRKPIPEGDLQKSRKDVLTLGPNDEVKLLMRWRDFLNVHVMHCHNVVHEDHAMMINWKIVPPGQGD